MHRRIRMGGIWMWEKSILIGAGIALVWANFWHTSYQQAIEFELWRWGPHLSIHKFVNEVLLCFFFLVAAKEVREAFLPNGSLGDARRMGLPLAATAGGIIVPAGIYVILSSYWAPQATQGWLIPTATDLAFAIMAATIVYGSHKHAAVTFLITIAILDDLIGLVLIPVVYSTDGMQWHWFGLAVAWGVIAPYVLRGFGVKQFWVYLLVGGVPVWLVFMAIHVEPALALAPLVIFMPHAANDIGYFRGEEGRRHDTLNEMERALKPFLPPILFAFGLVNAGVLVNGIGHLTGIVVTALLAGKLIGIAGFTAIALACRMSLPHGMRFSDVWVVGAAGSIGFTVSLFVADVALAGSAKNAASMGALLSLLTGMLATLMAAYWLRVGRFGDSKRLADPV